MKPAGNLARTPRHEELGGIRQIMRDLKIVRYLDAMTREEMQELAKQLCAFPIKSPSYAALFRRALELDELWDSEPDRRPEIEALFEIITKWLPESANLGRTVPTAKHVSQRLMHIVDGMKEAGLPDASRARAVELELERWKKRMNEPKPSGAFRDRQARLNYLRMHDMYLARKDSPTIWPEIADAFCQGGDCPGPPHRSRSSVDAGGKAKLRFRSKCVDDVRSKVRLLRKDLRRLGLLSPGK